MTEYLLIESRDPFESNDVGYYYDLARGLSEAGNQVTLFLTQNAVLAARPSAQAPQLRVLVGSGVKILADDCGPCCRVGSNLERHRSTPSRLTRPGSRISSPCCGNDGPISIAARC